MAYVLIVDDDEDFASAVATVLGEEGYETATEHSPETVLARIQERRPDAIVLDVMFPENPSAGFELARAIQRTHPGLPILMLTAVNQQFPLGFSNRDIDPTWLPITEFVEKPVDFQVLCEKMRTLCGSGRRA
jgi:DNA-binding response OmpR family regulator